MKTILILTALLGALGVGLGAFGAHGLEGELSESQLQNWDTAVKYQLIHVVVVLVILLQPKPSGFLLPAIFFVIGILLFSGSLYLLSLKDIFQLESLTKFIWPITPLGGLCYIIGWILLAINFLKLT